MNATTSTTSQRLSTLARLYEQGQTSPLMERTLDKLLAHEGTSSLSLKRWKPISRF